MAEASSTAGPGLTRRSRCRLCGGARLDRVLSLTPTPPANAFVPRERLEERQAAYPLDVHLCRGCGHAQLLDVVDPQILFRDYVYVSGTSPVFVEHFRRYADSVAELAGAGPGSLAVDIGSNDGTLLRFLRDRGMRVLGVDPAREIARRATESGIETLPVFFTAELARKLRGERGPARLIAANNVFAHADDLGDIADGVRALLERDGVFVFEVSYLGDVLENTLFDTIYHEHLSYHSLKPLPGFFRAHGLQVFDAQRVPTHGGSLRCMVQRDDGGRAVSPAVAALVAEEARKGLDRPETFERFAAGIGAVKDALTALLRRIRAEGGRVAGYGAPAKATTLLYHFDLGGALDFIVDDSPLKQGLYSPGFHIPVVGSQALAEKRPDYLLILAWNFAAPIMERCRDYGKAGGRFIVPLPKCEVLPR